MLDDVSQDQATVLLGKRALCRGNLDAAASTDGGEPKWERSRSVGGCYSIVDSISPAPWKESRSKVKLSSTS